MNQAVSRIAENLASVRGRIADAAERSGRTGDDVTLVGVVKYVSADVARMLVQAGCSDLGESRPQQLWEKARSLDDMQVRWHQIGHLQRNKLARTLPIVSVLHSLDSSRLAAGIDSWAADQNCVVAALVEVNISGDTSKHGFAPHDVQPFLRRAASYPCLRLLGLMCMASRQGGPNVARQNFRDLRRLRDDAIDQQLVGPAFRELSMGMSRDFEVAIEEGATLVRVGSALVEGLTLSE